MKFCEVGYYKKIIILQILLFCSLNDESGLNPGWRQYRARLETYTVSGPARDMSPAGLETCLWPGLGHVSSQAQDMYRARLVHVSSHARTCI